jgi:UDP-2-acetamido-2,6-beta-L-arabino-hexul-4-ose reductase
MPDLRVTDRWSSRYSNVGSENSVRPGGRTLHRADGEQSVKVTITGAEGFLGWHVRVLIRALGWPTPARVTRRDLTDPEAVAAKMHGSDIVLHLAGVNRGAPDEMAAGNVELAAALARGLRRCPTQPPMIVFANSIQAGNGTPYGDSKAAAADLLSRAVAGRSVFRDVHLANLYGEHGRPHYNSVVATFCSMLANGGVPEVRSERELALVHVGDAAAHLIDAPPDGPWDSTMPSLLTDVQELAARLRQYSMHYRQARFPALHTRHDVRLFNTYRSHCFPNHYPMALASHTDARGELVEAVKSHGGGGQTFCSSSRPAVTRGEHFHLAKVERFVVLRGSAKISLRRVGFSDVTRFDVTGADPVVVDMPTMWAHNVTNTGLGELLTLFWTNEIFDPQRPDTYPEPVSEPTLAGTAA